MIATAETKDLVSQRLTELVVRLHGAIDLWTVTCVTGVTPDSPAFIREQMGRLRTCIRDLTRLMQPDAGQEPHHTLLANIATGCDELERVFLALADFRTASPDAIASSIAELRLRYQELMHLIEELGDVFGVLLDSVDGRNPERKRYYQRILDGLPNLFCSPSC